MTVTLSTQNIYLFIVCCGINLHGGLYSGNMGKSNDTDILYGLNDDYIIENTKSKISFPQIIFAYSRMRP